MGKGYSGGMKYGEFYEPKLGRRVRGADDYGSSNHAYMPNESYSKNLSGQMGIGRANYQDTAPEITNVQNKINKKASKGMVSRSDYA